MLAHIYDVNAVSGWVKIVLLAINLPSFHAIGILGFFGCPLCLFLPLALILYPATLCQQVFLVGIERNDYLLRVDGSIVFSMLMLIELTIISLHEGDKGVVEFGGGPIEVFGADSCGKHLNLILGNDVEDSEKGEEFYQSALDPSDERAKITLLLNGEQGGVTLADGIREGDRADIIGLILDNRNQGFLLPLL